MKKSLFFLFLIAIFTGCSITSKFKRKRVEVFPLEIERIVTPPKRGISPLVRIFIEEEKTFTFNTGKFFRIYRDTLLGVFKEGTYKVRVKKARRVKLYYYGVLSEANSRSEAEIIKSEYEERNLPVKIIQNGVLIESTYDTVDTRGWLVTLGPFRNKRELLARTPHRLKGIISFPGARPHGKVQLLSEDGEKLLEVDDFFRILPGENIPQVFTVFGLSEKNNLRRGKRRALNFTGILEFRVSPDGKLYFINEVSLEEYLRGVLPSEMGPEFPLEALKAQAVIARTMVFASWGKKMAYIGKPYDFGRDVYFQVYRGITYRSDKTDRAVKLTRGEVLFYNGEVALTPYHSTCGGHTESGEIWGKGKPYLKGVWDTEDYHSLDLRREKDVRIFIEGVRDGYCSPDVYGNSLKGYRKTYRWTVSYKRNELERILKKKTGKYFGRLLDIVPVERGVSGRIKKLKIVGSEKTFIITGELNIRKALSKGYLKSSLFYVKRSGDRFYIVGAGYGHGVGLCQLGAAGRAIKGENYREILSHYYPGTYIKKLY